jgi:DNA-binding CsgD family transcriptional regulator
LDWLSNESDLDACAVAALAKLATAPSAPLPESLGPSPVLTPREIDVLRRVSLGDSNKEVARQLDISPSTVGTHLEKI